MLDAFGNDQSLLRLQINRALFKIDDEVSLQDKEELVVVVMPLPLSAKSGLGIKVTVLLCRVATLRTMYL